jgi:hypothetical protein
MSNMSVARVCRTLHNITGLQAVWPVNPTASTYSTSRSNSRGPLTQHKPNICCQASANTRATGCPSHPQPLVQKPEGNCQLSSDCCGGQATGTGSIPVHSSTLNHLPAPPRGGRSNAAHRKCSLSQQASPFQSSPPPHKTRLAHKALQRLNLAAVRRVLQCSLSHATLPAPARNGASSTRRPLKH